MVVPAAESCTYISVLCALRDFLGVDFLLPVRVVSIIVSYLGDPAPMKHSSDIDRLHWSP